MGRWRRRGRGRRERTFSTAPDWQAIIIAPCAAARPVAQPQPTRLARPPRLGVAEGPHPAAGHHAVPRDAVALRVAPDKATARAVVLAALRDNGGGHVAARRREQPLIGVGHARLAREDAPSAVHDDDAARRKGHRRRRRRGGRRRRFSAGAAVAAVGAVRANREGARWAAVVARSVPSVNARVRARACGLCAGQGISPITIQPSPRAI